jgi:hypothetical protein
MAFDIAEESVVNSHSLKSLKVPGTSFAEAFKSTSLMKRKEKRR